MESGGGILGRLGEKMLAWVAFGLLILVGVWIYLLGPEGRGNLWSWIWRSAAWLTIAAAVPWSSRLWIRRVLSISSNWAGAGLLAGLCLADVVAGVLLIEHWPTGWWWLAAGAALAVVGTYNYLVAEYLSQQAGG